MYIIITEPSKEHLIDIPEWEHHSCALAYCEILYKQLPNLFFGVRLKEDK